MLLLQAILRATKSSFAAMKKRLAGISNAGAASAERPFFDVSVELTVPKVTMNPTLDDIQAAINATAKKVDMADILPRCIYNGHFHCTSCLQFFSYPDDYVSSVDNWCHMMWPACLWTYTAEACYPALPYIASKLSHAIALSCQTNRPTRFCDS